jgi:hypothetical protein
MSAEALLEAKKNMTHTVVPAHSIPVQRSFEFPGRIDPGTAPASSGHDFGQVAVNAPLIAAGTCPLSLVSPRACPFGGACHTCPARVQAKLAVGQPGDSYEQEADQVAEAITRTAETPVLQRKCVRCGDDHDQNLQMKAASDQAVGMGVQPDAQSAVNEVLRSPGQSLDEGTRASMEGQLGQDFSQVRVHTDARAAASAEVINALAYTVGRDIVFGASQYMPLTLPGKRMLAHELVHVVQQNGSDLQIIQRRCADHSDETYYSRNMAYCRDTPSTGRLHPNHRSYREIPIGSGCPPGEHVCFNKTTGLCDANESHVDSTAPSLVRKNDGSCDLSWLGWCSMVHGALDVAGPVVGSALRLMGPPNNDPNSLEYKMWLRYHRRM